MNNITTAKAAALTFSFNSNDVRVVMRNGEPWFVATDIAQVLGYRNAPDAARNLPEHQKSSTQIVRSTAGGNPNLTIISEGGMYRLVLRSRKPEAEAFTDWVTDEVLPSIRKTGTYAATSSLPGLPTATLTGQEVYAVWFLVGHFKALHEWAAVNKVPQALAWLGSTLGHELRDRLLDGMGGGVGPLEKALSPEFEQCRAYADEVRRGAFAQRRAIAIPA